MRQLNKKVSRRAAAEETIAQRKDANRGEGAKHSSLKNANMEPRWEKHGQKKGGLAAVLKGISGERETKKGWNSTQGGGPEETWRKKGAGRMGSDAAPRKSKS